MQAARVAFKAGDDIGGGFCLGFAMACDESVAERHYWLWDFEMGRMALHVKFRWQN